MIRINNTELNAHGYVSTDGVMNVEFETESSLDEIAKLFSEAKTIEIFDDYSVKSVDNILIQGDSPRKISVQMTVGGVEEEASAAAGVTEAESTAKEPETLEEYAKAVSSGLLDLSDVPANIRDNVAIKLGV